MTYESNIFRFTVKHIETLLVIKKCMKEVRIFICIILIWSEGVIVSASACSASESFFLSATDSVERTSVVIAEPFNADTVIG